MAKTAGRLASLYLYDSTGACKAMSALLNSITFSQSAEAPESTGFGDVNRTRLNNSLRDVELTFDAYFATGAAETDAVLSGILAGSTRYYFGPAGSANTDILWHNDAILTSYEMNFTVADAATVSGTLVNYSGSPTRGTWADILT